VILTEVTADDQATAVLDESTPSSARIFFAILWRDIFVTGREIGPFLAQVVIQPFLMLFIFGKVLRSIGYVQGNFAQILLPGVIALNGFLGGLQNTALPLVMDFSWSREVEDRLLAPLPVHLVAVEKMVFGALKGMLAAVLMIPIGFLILDGISWPIDQVPAALAILLLGCVLGATTGMALGTLVQPRRINIIFSVALAPLMFTGSTQFPWAQLGNLGWFQVLCAFNPLTYVSEGVRGLLVPSVHHIPVGLDLLAILGASAIFGGIGVRGFLRRAIS